MQFFNERENKRKERAKYLKIWVKLFKIRKCFEKVQVVACSYIILEMDLKRVTNTISFIAIQRMKSEILREQNSQLVLVHILLVICVAAMPPKWIN